MTEAIEYERHEELYRGKGRIWLEAESRLGVSRGALAEVGVHGRIEEGLVDGMPPLVDGAAEEAGVDLFTTPPQRMPDVICRRGAARAPTLDDELLEPSKPLTRKEQGKQDAQKLAVLLAEGELKPDTRRAFEEMQQSLGRFPSLTDRQRAWVDSMLDEQGLDWRDPRVKNANVPRGREVPTPEVLKQLPLAPPGRKPPAFPPEHPASKAAAVQGGDPWPWDEPGRVRGDVVSSAPNELPLTGRTFRVDMTAVRAAAERAAEGALFELPPGSVLGETVELNERGLDELGRDPALRQRLLASAHEQSRKSGRPVRFVGPRGVELGVVDGDEVRWTSPMPAAAAAAPYLRPFASPPAPEAPKAAPAAPRPTAASSSAKGARTRRRSALATDD